MCVCPGARAIYQTLMSSVDLTEPLWCERTQDMSGYVIQDSTLPPSGEHVQFKINTAQYENDIDVQNSENPSPEELILGDPLDAVLSEEYNMFDKNYYNYTMIDDKIKDWLPTISDTEIDEFTKTSMIEENADFRVQITSENSPILPKTGTVEKNKPATVKKNSFSIFECEEPVIEEDLESQSSCFIDKLALEVRDEIEVAEEVVVTTESFDEQEFKTSFLTSTDAFDYPMLIKEDSMTTHISTLRDLTSMESLNDFEPFDEDENCLYNLDSLNAQVPESTLSPKLHLDITAAMETSVELLELGDLPDTPEVLKPVLCPGPGFDILTYLNNNSDSNNNTAEPCVIQHQEKRKGKSISLLAGLKASELDDSKPLPGSSKSNNRPSRRSPKNINKRFQDGLLKKTQISHYDSTDEEEYVPKTKHRKKTGHSSTCETDLKYRERRDKNNLSSKRSRQKRKDKQELLKKEMMALEKENFRLKRRVEKYAATLHRVHMAWKEYLKKD